MDTAHVPPRPAYPPRVPPRWRPTRRAALIAGASAVVLGVVLALALGGGHGSVRPLPGFRAAGVRTVVLDGVSGTVRVTADDDARDVTGSFHRPDGRPAALRGSTSDGGVLALDCPDGGGRPQPCAGALTLVLPAHTGLRIRQTSGEAVLDGLGGDLSLDASSIRLTTRDLRPAHAAVTVVSGSADLGFSAAPAGLDVHATSASVAVRLPRTDGGYAVTTSKTSADVQVGVPQDPTAAQRVGLTVTSGSLSVQDA
ncbi:hypothetical protein [Streptomyces sp. NRRL F-5123]|uniref:hypothetical protein n=1 Tax=Streptomyces sp. NRRL F-5123 TaxID=1463856 RepID=UPI0004E1FE15|nr:hypothetical protein [Streptomyces sp. NRRL F-5123]